MKEQSRLSGFINIGFNLLFGALTLGVTIIFAYEPMIASVLLAILFAAGMLKWRDSSVFVTSLFGLIAGTCCEMALTARGVWEYGHSDFLGVPVYLFFIWLNAAAFIYQTGDEVRRLFGEDDAAACIAKPVLNGPWFPVIVCLTSFLSVMLMFGHPWLLLEFNLILSITALTIWKSKTTVFVFVFAGISGACSEVVAINYGLWRYFDPGALIIPLWIVIAWGCVGACLYRIGRASTFRKVIGDCRRSNN
jgi:hypothetical protein